MITPAAQVERFIGKWARLWLVRHPGCQNHRSCQWTAEADRLRRQP